MEKKISQKSFLPLLMTFGCQKKATAVLTVKHQCLSLPLVATRTIRRVGTGLAPVQILPSLVCQEDSPGPQTLKPSGLICRRERVVLSQFDAKVGLATVIRALHAQNHLQ